MCSSSKYYKKICWHFRKFTPLDKNKPKMDTFSSCCKMSDLIVKSYYKPHKIQLNLYIDLDRQLKNVIFFPFIVIIPDNTITQKQVVKLHS